MLQNIDITSMPEAEQAAGSCCGGSCGVADASAESSATTSQTFEVEGMTCGHCVSSVTEEISGLAGVEGVDIALVPGGRSTVTVASDSALRVEDVRAAVAEAGYTLVQG